MTAASTGTQAVEDEVRARIREEVEALEGGLQGPVKFCLCNLGLIPKIE